MVVDPITHKVIKAQTFDTHGEPEENERLQQALHSIPDDHIVAMAACDDATENLHEDTSKLIEELGSKHISKTGFREPWAFIGLKGKNNQDFQYNFEATNHAQENSFAFVRN